MGTLPINRTRMLRRYDPALGDMQVTPYVMMLPKHNGRWVRYEEAVVANSEDELQLKRQIANLEQRYRELPIDVNPEVKLRNLLLDLRQLISER